MARRRIKNDPREYIPTPDRQLEHPSGWCMTNDHAGCKYQFDHGKCGCDCHIKAQKTQRPREKVMAIVDAPKKRGRPPKTASNSSDPRPWRQ